MKTNIQINLTPFSVPNVVTEIGTLPVTAYATAPAAPTPCDTYNKPFITSRQFNLEELDEVTLSNMCDEFRAEIFRRAGKPDQRVAE